MAFTSIEEIRERFSFSENDTPQEIRLQLRRIVTEKHPDTTRGRFESEEQKAIYNDAREAADFIDKTVSLPSQNLVVPANIQDLVKVVVGPLVKETSEALQLQIQDLQSRLDTQTEGEKEKVKRQETIDYMNELETNVSQQIEHAVKEIQLPKYVPVVTLGVLLTLLAAIMLLPQRVNDNQTLQAIIDVHSIGFVRVWVGLTLLTIAVWIASWFIESRYRRKYQALAREDYQSKLFSKFRQFHKSCMMFGSPFSKSDLTTFIFLSECRNGGLDTIMDTVRYLEDSASQQKRNIDFGSPILTDLEATRTELTAKTIRRTITESETAQLHQIRELIDARTHQKNEVNRVMRSELQKVYKKFQDSPIQASLFPHITGVIEPAIAAQVSEIICQRGLVKARLRKVDGSSVDDWFIDVVVA